MWPPCYGHCDPTGPRLPQNHSSIFVLRKIGFRPPNLDILPLYYSRDKANIPYGNNGPDHMPGRSPATLVSTTLLREDVGPTVLVPNSSPTFVAAVALNGTRLLLG